MCVPIDDDISSQRLDWTTVDRPLRLRLVEAGEPGFVKMWEDMGGNERFDRRRRCWASEKDRFEQAI